MLELHHLLIALMRSQVIRPPWPPKVLGFLHLSFSDTENTMIPPIYHSAEIQGNYVEIPHGVIPIRSRDYYELVNPFIMKINAKYSDVGY